MKGFCLIILIAIHAVGNGQPGEWKQNKNSVDSLINEIKQNSQCSLTGSSIKNATVKQRLDVKLFSFLNDFYFGRLDANSIERTLKTSFGQKPWRFDQIEKVDSLIRYQGRIKSFGNLEAFIGYVVFREEVIGRRIYFRIRSTLDCLKKNDGEFPDIVYLSNFISNHIYFRLDLSIWQTFIHSDIWKKDGLTTDLAEKVDSLLSRNSAL